MQGHSSSDPPRLAKLDPDFHGSEDKARRAYAIAFSFAYRDLSAGSGALLLFGAVQMTMILWGWQRGERPSLIQFAGLTLALAGVAWLVWPRVSAPPPIGWCSWPMG